MLFLDATQNRFTSRPPVWFMRQAGRYLPEYRALRKKYSFLEMVYTPELACEVTLQPLTRFGFDAAILYSDILVVPQLFGLHFDFIEGKGPVLRESIGDFNALLNYTKHEWDRPCLDPIYQAVRMIRSEVEPKNTALIGFAGSPFTVACYLVEQGSSKDFSKVHDLIASNPAGFHELLSALTDATIYHLQEQIKNGAQAIQLFDTWGSILNSEHYTTFSRTYLQRIFDALRPSKVPLTLFMKDTQRYLNDLSPLPIDILGVDWESDLATLKQKRPDLCLQGNLSPHVLNESKETALKHCKQICESMQQSPGFIFNLGHGILPSTPLENVEAVVDYVKNFKNVKASS